MNGAKNIDRASLADALAQGATVVTPNRRLARALKSEFDRAQQVRGLTVWMAADVLPWSAWLARCHDELAQLRPQPLLLSPLQQQTLWRRVIGQSTWAAGLPQLDALAATASAAWDRLHEEDRLAALERAPSPHEDHQAFHDAARQFARQLKRLDAISAGEVAGLLVDAVEALSWRPARPVLLVGFDRLPAAGHLLVTALAERGAAVTLATLITPRAAPTTVRRIECASMRTQWQQVAAWARARLDANPTAHIGIVVPDLAAHRDAVVHALTDALTPQARVAPRQEAARPFNLSLGAPLADTPLVATALRVLALADAPLAIDDVTRVLGSPFLAGGAPGEGECDRRAQLDRGLREDGHWRVSLDTLRRRAHRRALDGELRADTAPQLAEALSRIAQRLASMQGRRHPLSTWVTVMFGALADVGFPGTRTLDSVEYQTYRRLRELIAGLGSLDLVSSPVALGDAVNLLRRAAADTVFQPESPDAPVQVLGVLESSHLVFDHLWVANASELMWPPEPQPNPLLPLALQRAWQLPEASAELALARAVRQMAGWRASASELVYSHARLDGDRPCLPSPLTADLPPQPWSELAAPVAAPIVRTLARGVAMTPMVDVQAPPLDVARAAALRGGARVIEDQSACAFRAFAVHRVHAHAPAEPAPGLDASDRGRLLHDTVAALWGELGSQAALRALDDVALHASVVAAAGQALDRLAAERPDAIGARGRELESERLLRAVHAWLAIEDMRPPFTVETVEATARMSLGGLNIRVRPDRVDRLHDGSLAIIDYKTGRVSTRAWLDTRPDAPQLPLYAHAYASGALGQPPQPVGALVFAQLRPGDTVLAALAARDGLLPATGSVRVVGDADMLITRAGWHGLLADWQLALEQLASQFVGGAAAVAPKSNESCRHCELALLCRRHERADWSARLAEPGDLGASDD